MEIGFSDWPVPIDGCFVFQYTVYHIFQFPIRWGRRSFAVRIQLDWKVTEWLPTKEIWSHHPVPVVVMFVVRHSKIMSKKVFQLEMITENKRELKTRATNSKIKTISIKFSPAGWDLYYLLWPTPDYFTRERKSFRRESIITILINFFLVRQELHKFTLANARGFYSSK